jgi:DNA polymerase-3 subunit epsilon
MDSECATLVGGLAMRGPDARPLAQLDILVLDCQATAAAPRGHLLELGWARAGRTTAPTRTCLVKLPDHDRIPGAVRRITGISDDMAREGIDRDAAWRMLAGEAASLDQQPAPTVVHFARFERPFLTLLAGGTPPLDVVCTHEIATRLLPDLPRRSLRALTGYFGRAVGVLHRSAGHVEATAFVWRELIPLLEAEGVGTWSALLDWLAAPTRMARRTRRVWPMPREVRLALPDDPGVYRMLRTSGDVLYVGKASSIRHRVNSYFRRQSGVSERMLEMLSQARALSFDVAPTPLEAALLECDQIKELRPPYNVALGLDDRAVWFAAPDLRERSRRRSPHCPVGPFPSSELLEQFAAMAERNPAALGHGRRAPEGAIFDAGYERLIAAHAELSLDRLSMRQRLLRLGARLWREGRRDQELEDAWELVPDERIPAWTPEHVQVALEWLALRAALARRRAKWLTRLVDATVAWREPGSSASRFIIIEHGDISSHGALDSQLAPVPPGHRRTIAARREAFTVARFDRLRVLNTELKRLVAAGGQVSVRLSGAAPLTGARLRRVLSWV